MMKKNVPEAFENAVASFYGAKGGNAESPVWLCGLEWGERWSTEHPREPGFYRKDYSPEAWSLSQDVVKRYMAEPSVDAKKGRPSGNRFYQMQVGLVHAIVSDTDEGRPAEWVDKFGFFSKGRYGLSLNAFPVSLKGGPGEEKRWKEDKVLLVHEELGRAVSFAEWTGIATFAGYRKWCVATRRKVFSMFRREYHPAIIYCSGAHETKNFFDIWTDENDWDAQGGAFKGIHFRGNYLWLSNGPDKNSTLLAVGPSFGSQNGLDSHDKCWWLGRTLRRLCDEKFNDGGAWLQRERFMPQ